MITYDAVESNLRMSHFVLTSLLGDFTDEELLARPAGGGNHVAWQLGHLIGAEYILIAKVTDKVKMTVPEGWSDKYAKELASSDDASLFEGKSRYLGLYDAQRQATLDALKTMSEADLAKPGPEELSMLMSTVGELFLFQAHHELMHAGQFTCIRRSLGKPVLF